MIRLAFFIFALIFAFPAIAQIDIQVGPGRDRGYDRDRSLPRGYDERRLEPQVVYPEDNNPEFGEYRRGHRHDRRHERQERRWP